MPNLIDTALLYAKRGWHVLPLTPGEKTPLGRLVPNGVKDATNVESTIKEWWTAEPQANIGIAAGACGLVCVDIDVKDGHNGEKAWAQLLAELNLKQPDTWVVTTPSGGKHVYYTTTQALSPSAGKLGDGLDIRAGNSYVVAPPSATSEGFYTPNRRLAFTTIAPLPSALLSRLQKQIPATPSEVSIIEDVELPAEVERAREALSRLSATRANNYSDWVAVGMALRELGPAGLTLFDEFSQQSEKYYKADSSGRVGYAMVEYAWLNLQKATANAITLGSLYHWVEEDNNKIQINDMTIKKHGSFTLPSGTRFVTFADVEGEVSNITWAWNDWIPNGFLTMLAGNQSIGKSILLLQLAGCFTNGWDWPDGTPFTGKRGKVLWVEGECSEGLNIERARDWGMDLNEIVLCSEGLDEAPFNVLNTAHIAVLEEALAMDDIVFMVVDSLSGVHSTAENKEEMLNTMRLFNIPLNRTGKPGVISHHLRKPSQGGANIIDLDSVRGSGTITQLARSVMGLDAPDAEHPDWKRLSSLKLNIKRAPKPIGLEHTDAYGRFQHTPKVPEYNKVNTTKHTQFDAAMSLLKVELADGRDATPDEIIQLAKENDISEATIRRAERELGVKHASKNSKIYWSL